MNRAELLLRLASESADAARYKDLYEVVDENRRELEEWNRELREVLEAIVTRHERGDEIDAFWWIEARRLVGDDEGEEP